MRKLTPFGNKSFHAKASCDLRKFMGWADSLSVWVLVLRCKSTCTWNVNILWRYSAPNSPLSSLCAILTATVLQQLPHIKYIYISTSSSQLHLNKISQTGRVLDISPSTHKQNAKRLKQLSVPNNSSSGIIIKFIDNLPSLSVCQACIPDTDLPDTLSL